MNLAAGHQPDTGQRLQQLALPVARDAGYTHDLAGPDIETDVIDARNALAVDHGQVAHRQSVFAGFRGRLVELQSYLPSHHQLRELLARRLPGGQGCNHLALPHHGDRVGDRQDFPQLVSDEHNGDAARIQGPQDLEQLIRLLRGQDAGRLIQDQDIAMTEQRLQNLHPLLLTYGQLGDMRIGIDVEAVIARQPLQLRPRLRGAAAQQRTAFGAQHDVFENGERLHQHEILMHHADAGGDRIM